MKSLIAVVLLLAGAVTAFAQPDPRDSIILESKTVNPGAHPGSATDTAAYLYVKMSITNVDTLYALVLALQESSVSGGAYATLGRPRNFNGMVNRLTNTLRASRVSLPSQGTAPGQYYNSASPDSFLLAGIFDPITGDFEPPNLVRKAFWELKFDSVWANPGTFELDTATVLQSTGFTNTVSVDKPVNFVKNIITVAYPKGDLNQDISLSPSDAVWILNCVMQGTPPPAGMAACDLNCDGQGTPADVVLELNAVFLGEAFPC
jgi:hypothetical protein